MSNTSINKAERYIERVASHEARPLSRYRQIEKAVRFDPTDNPYRDIFFKPDLHGGPGTFVSRIGKKPRVFESLEAAVRARDQYIERRQQRTATI
jgi:hypothetical protein